MLAMEIEKRRKRSLEVENENTEEDTEREGDWFDVRQILLDIKNTKKRAKLDPVMVEEYIKSKPYTKEKSKPDENQVNSETRKFSNRWKDAVKVICQICGRSENCNVLRSHTRKIHGISITDYKHQFGPLSDYYVERVYHEWRVRQGAAARPGRDCPARQVTRDDARGVHSQAHHTEQGGKEGQVILELGLHMICNMLFSFMDLF